MVVIQYMYKYLIRDTANKSDERADFDTQLQCWKTDRTHYTECGVRTELVMVAWKKCVMDM
jgi:hypothetical protein